MPYFGIPIRNGLPIGLGSVAGFGVQQFSPADLFSAGEQGAWYDPSDLTTLFDDSAGTTPVTAVEQFVGLMLDKSKGLVLGSELATGILGSTSGWTFVGAANVTGGAIVFNTPPSTNASAQYNPIVASGKWYQSTITITGTGQVTVQLGSAGTTVTLVAPGTYTFRGLASGGTPTVLTFSSVLSSVNNFVGSVTAISVRELPGNHATQTTSAKRPKLAARYNLLTYTEQFDNGAWVKSTASVTAPTAIVAPDGTLTTDKLVEGVGTARKVIYQSGATSNQTVSIYAQKGERDFVAIGQTNTAGFWAVSLFNLNLGTYVASYEAGGQPIPTNNTITSVGNNWYRISCTLNGTSMANPVIMISNGGNPIFEGYTGDGTSGIYIWGADLRPASQATGLIGPAYQRVVDAATYDAVGFLPYLEFNGLSWSMGTGSIDATAVDKAQVFAGARKLSDALYGTVIETSVDSDANNGSLAVFNPNSAKWDMRLKGNGLVGSSFSETYTAPLTNVLTLLANTAGATFAEKLIPRINGVVDQDSTTGAIGTGNFGNYPLYIGQRGGSSVPFNGWLSSLIVRFGANLSQGQIEATESWVNQKTGAF